MEEEIFPVLRPVIDKLISDKDQNKQRGAAELLAGLLGGSKNWPTDAQDRLWAWFTPKLDQILGANVKTDTLTIWSSFLEVSSCSFPSATPAYSSLQVYIVQ